MVRNFLMTAAVCTFAFLASTDEAFARGGRGGRGGQGGCSSGGCSSGGSSYYGSSCASGSCGTAHYGAAQYGMSHYGSACASGSCGGVALMPTAGGASCSGGACYLGAASFLAQAADVPANHATASIVVNLPADAVLTVQGQATTSTTGTRILTTPALEQGHSYAYTLQIAVTRDGRTQTSTEQVIVRAGEQAQVRFELPAATSVAAR